MTVLVCSLVRLFACLLSSEIVDADGAAFGAGDYLLVLNESSTCE